MIVKKIRADKTRSKVASITALTNYIVDPTAKNSTERLAYQGARGFVTDTFGEQQQEMIAMALGASRSAQPVMHWILSWKEGELPAAPQIEEAVSIFLQELQLKGHQAIYALHADTDNFHLHIAVNRVHPLNGKVIKPNKGFDLEAAHRAIAKIELLQGWRSEANARYSYAPETAQFVKATQEMRQACSTKVPTRARDMEVRSGIKSAARCAKEGVVGLLELCSDWQSLHSALAARGMRYEKRAGGAVIILGDVALKASSIGRPFSLSHLQKRFGLFQPGADAVVLRAPEALRPELPDWHVYMRARREHGESRRAVAQGLRDENARRQQELRAQQKAERQVLRLKNWKGRGDELNIARSMLAKKQAMERAALRDWYLAARTLLRQRLPRFPDYEQWLESIDRPDLARAWRFQSQQTLILVAADAAFRDYAPFLRQDIRDYEAVAQYGMVTYRHLNQATVAFVDRGREIEIFDEVSVLAALQLGAAKWGRLELRGSQSFVQYAAMLAKKNGIQISCASWPIEVRHEAPPKYSYGLHNNSF